MPHRRGLHAGLDGVARQIRKAAFLRMTFEEIRLDGEVQRTTVAKRLAEMRGWTLASLGVLREAGWAWVHERAAGLAETLAGLLGERGIEVAPRGRTTLVSWRSPDPEAEVARLFERGIVVRSIPIGGWVRASVGAWTSEDELERLVEAVAPL